MRVPVPDVLTTRRWRYPLTSFFWVQATNNPFTSAFVIGLVLGFAVLYSVFFVSRHCAKLYTGLTSNKGGKGGDKVYY